MSNRVSQQEENYRPSFTKQQKERGLQSKPNNSLQLITTDHKMKCFAVKCQDQWGNLGNSIGLCENFPLMEKGLLMHKDSM